MRKLIYIKVLMVVATVFAAVQLCSAAVGLDERLQRMYEFDELPSSKLALHKSKYLTYLPEDMVRERLLQIPMPDISHMTFNGIGCYKGNGVDLCFFSSYDFYSPTVYVCILSNFTDFKCIGGYPPALKIYRQVGNAAESEIWFGMNGNTLKVYQLMMPTEVEILVIDTYKIGTDRFTLIGTEKITELEEGFNEIKQAEVATKAHLLPNNLCWLTPDFEDLEFFSPHNEYPQNQSAIKSYMENVFNPQSTLWKLNF